MKTIYLDENYICHINNQSNYKIITTDKLDIYSNIAIEYIRYIPEGEEWMNKTTGRIFYGPFI